MKTLIVNTANGLVMINAEDFNPEIHSAAEGHEIPKPADIIVPAEFDLDALREQIRAEMRAILEPEIRAEILAEMATLGADTTIAADKADAVSGQDNPPVPMLVTKKGKKYIVIGADGVAIAAPGIEAGGYDSEQAAWDAILALTPAAQ